MKSGAREVCSLMRENSTSRGVRRTLLEGANFCFMGACGQWRCLRRQGQKGIYVAI